MLYLLGLVAVVTMIAVMWVAIGAGPKPAQPRRRVLAPDDDPEFLRRLSERYRRPPES